MRLAVLCFALLAAVPAFAENVEPALQAAVDNPARSANNKARDPYRHPLEALSFFPAPRATGRRFWRRT
jgi:predicted methyltransferase